MSFDFIFIIAIVIMSVVIHEVSHGYVAGLLGDPTARLAGRLTLNPIKHLDLFGSVLVPGLLWLISQPLGGFIFGWAKPVPYNPYNLQAGRAGPGLVAVAGPASNLIIALVFGLLIRGGVFPAVASQLALWAVMINIGLAVFNLIPVAPLDGSKILLTLIPARYQQFTAWLEHNQLIVMIVLLLILFNTSWLDLIVFSLFRLIAGVGV